MRGIKQVALAVLITLCMTFQAMATPVVTTGGKSGTYIKVGYAISKSIGGNVKTSKGGEENINRLLKGEANVGLAQMDTFAYMATKKPELTNSVEIMGPLYKEAVYIAVNTRGRVKDEDDLQKEGVTIAIGKKGSGGASTWDYMRELEPGYKKAAVSFTGGIRALGKLAAQTEGDIDAVLFVTKPILGGKMMTTVMKNENLKFIHVNDKDLNDKYKPTGKPVYEFCKIDLSKGFFNDKELSTICMDAVVLANSETDEDYLESLSGLLLNYKATLLK